MLLFNSNLSSQNRSYINYRKQLVELKQANQYLKIDSLKLAKKYFVRAMKIGDLDFYNSVQAAYCFGLIGDEHHLIKVVENLPMKHLLFCNKDTSYYCVLNQDILNDTVIVKILNTRKGILALKKIQTRINTSYSQINWKIYTELKSMHEKDQAIRFADMEYWGKPKSPAKDSITKLMTEIDSINFSKFIKIIKENGWPDMNKYGDVVDVLLWHINIELKFIDSIAYKAAINNFLDWDTYEHFYKRAIFFDSLFQVGNYKIKYKKNNALTEAKLQATIDYLEYYRKLNQVNLSLVTNCTSTVENTKKSQQIKRYLGAYGVQDLDINLRVLDQSKFDDYILIELKK